MSHVGRFLLFFPTFPEGLTVQNLLINVNKYCLISLHPVRPFQSRATTRHYSSGNHSQHSCGNASAVKNELNKVIKAVDDLFSK